MIERVANIGDRVKVGDVLARLEPDRFEAAVKRLTAERLAAQALLENAEKQLARQEELLQKGFTPQARVDERQAAERAARAKVAALTATLDRAKLDLTHTKVLAPFDGTVSETFVENFQNVVAKQPILRLLDTTLIEMIVNVPESLIGLAKYVKDIQVTFKTLPGVSIAAKIKEISNEASLTTRTYPVKIVMDQPEGAPIKPGMAGVARATVEVPQDFAKRGILIPASAVHSPDTSSTDKSFVWIVDESSSTVSLRPVNVVSFNERGLLTTGIKPGERIVIAGVSLLAEGQKVRIQDTTRSSAK